MILKTKREDAWEYLDHIDSITIDDEITCKDRFVHYWRNGELLKQSINSACYLLNDVGRTIERIS